MAFGNLNTISNLKLFFSRHIITFWLHNLLIAYSILFEFKIAVTISSNNSFGFSNKIRIEFLSCFIKNNAMTTRIDIEIFFLDNELYFAREEKESNG